MEWLSGFTGFRIRTLFISILVVYLLLQKAKLSPKGKKAVWLSALVFLVLRVVLELIAVSAGLWSYQAGGFSLLGLPIDILGAMAILFGAGASLYRQYLVNNTGSALLGYLGLAFLATLYDYSGQNMYAFFTFGSGGYIHKLFGYLLLVWAAAAFYSWYTGNNGE